MGKFLVLLSNIFGIIGVLGLVYSTYICFCWIASDLGITSHLYGYSNTTYGFLIQSQVFFHASSWVSYLTHKQVVNLRKQKNDSQILDSNL